LISLSLNINKAGKGIPVDIFIAWVAFIISERKFKAGLLIIGIASVIELVSYNLYCSTWLAMICQRNFFVISSIPIFFFGIGWLAISVSVFIMKVLGPRKTKGW